MARPRSKNSKLSLGGLGMLPSQDERIKFFIKEDDNIPSLKYLLRSLLRKWLEEQERKTIKMEAAIDTPSLDTIGKIDWLKTKSYSKDQLKEIENLINNRIWITTKRSKISILDMSVNHIRNYIKCWNGEGKMVIPSYYLGGKDKWLKIFQSELVKRQ